MEPLGDVEAESRGKIAASVELILYGENKSFPKTFFSKQCHMTIPETMKSIAFQPTQ